MASCCDSERLELAGLKKQRSAKEVQEVGLNMDIVPHTRLVSLMGWMVSYFVHPIKEICSQVTGSIDQYLYQLTSRNLERARNTVSSFKANGCAQQREDGVQGASGRAGRRVQARKTNPRM